MTSFKPTDIGHILFLLIVILGIFIVLCGILRELKACLKTCRRFKVRKYDLQWLTCSGWTKDQFLDENGYQTWTKDQLKLVETEGGWYVWPRNLKVNRSKISLGTLQPALIAQERSTLKNDLLKGALELSLTPEAYRTKLIIAERERERLKLKPENLEKA